MNVVVIGAGAAGVFAAIQVKYNHPEAKVQVLEKSDKSLAKVKISGGGRCNVTTGIQEIKALSECYPRGKTFMRKALYQFNSTNTQEWFTTRGVALKTESDLRVFPKSNQSQSIIDCLMSELKKFEIPIKYKTRVLDISPRQNGFDLNIKNAPKKMFCDYLIIATGGSPKSSGFDWLRALKIDIIDPVPSLFTFNIPKTPLSSLMGISVPNAIIKIEGSKLSTQGPMLITHWGLSGPAILKLSAFGARELEDRKYDFNILVNWIGNKNQNLVREELLQTLSENSKKKLEQLKLFALPSRLWKYLIEKAGLSPNANVGELGSKSINKILNVLCNESFHVSGKTTFKEEFVTAGGVDLKQVNNKTLESKSCPQLFFCGEVLNIDGITGGFNFQAAWTTAYIAGQLNSTNK